MVDGNSSISMTEDGSGFVKQDSIRFSQSNFLYHHKTDEPIDAYYTLGELLGEGGFGVVYRGTHKKTKAQRAIKRMEKDPRDQELSEEIIREFEFLKELDHPNLIKVYDMFEDKPNFHIVTDLYGGGDLIDYLEDAVHLVENQVQIFMNKLLSCIEYLHDSRLMAHRDLKLENILLDTDQNLADLKLIDFGLARHFKPDETFYELCGSTAYVAPQVIEGEYTAKCDIWSCGVIAFSLLSGYTPFEGYDDGETLQIILGGTFDFNDPVWEPVSKDAKDFICNLLAYEEKDRPTAHQALSHPWLQTHRATQLDESTTDMDTSLRESLRGLRHFTSKGCKLKQAACAILASQILQKEEKEALTHDFQFLNRSLGGSITRQDLRQALADVDMDDSDAAVDAIMEQVNFSGSGAISYSEFFIAMMFEREMVDENKLRLVFNLLDNDADGEISVADLQATLHLAKESCAKMLAPLNCNANGTLSFEQFKDTMLSEEDMDGSNYMHSSFRMHDEGGRKRLDSSDDLPETVVEVDESMPDESAHTQKTGTTAGETPVPEEETPAPEEPAKEEETAPAAAEEEAKGEEEEETTTKKEMPSTEEAPPASADGKMSIERLRFVYMWYMRFGHPDRATMIRKASKMGDGCPISKEEIMSLPWKCGGAFIAVKDINAANASNVDAGSGDITNKRSSLKDDAKASAEAAAAVEDDKKEPEPTPEPTPVTPEPVDAKAPEVKPEPAAPAPVEAKAEETKPAFMMPSQVKAANKNKVASLASRFGGAAPTPVRTASNKNPLKVSSVLAGGANDGFTTELKIDSIHSESGKAETVKNTRQAASRRDVTIFGPTKKAPDFDWNSLENKTLKIASVEERKNIKPDFNWTCIARADMGTDESNKENGDSDGLDMSKESHEEVGMDNSKDESEATNQDESRDTLDMSLPHPNDMHDNSEMSSSPGNDRMSASEPGTSQRRRSSNIYTPGAKSADSQKMKFPKNNRRGSTGMPPKKRTDKSGKRRISTRD
ncbi:MAP kinase-activated protein kinase 2 (Fragment) [Seminavis robusta]|uniref:non-specific serine/threonine protein kinase n=1 Tax=Seminavis robusta TaxID=568900 RepID=A0A9N8DWW9_9STRA